MVGQLVDGPSVPGYPLPTARQFSLPAGSFTCEGPTIAGLNMPGQWLLKKARRVFGWQIQQPNFMTGATVVPKGDPLMEVEYEVRIWESAAMSAFLLLCQSILKKPAAAVPGVPAAAALGITDPTLKVYGVTSVVVLFVDIPKNPLVTSGGRGPWVGAVGFLEYRKPLPALPVPDQTIPDPGAVTPAAASANLATTGAALAAGAGALQGAAASALVPPR